MPQIYNLSSKIAAILLTPDYDAIGTMTLGESVSSITMLHDNQSQFISISGDSGLGSSEEHLAGSPSPREAPAGLLHATFTPLVWSAHLVRPFMGVPIN